MSAGVTKCQVGRRTCVRRIVPVLNARSIAASLKRRDRIASAHFDSPYSCACTAPSQLTTSTGVASGTPVSRWFRSRASTRSSDTLSGGSADLAANRLHHRVDDNPLACRVHVAAVVAIEDVAVVGVDVRQIDKRDAAADEVLAERLEDGITLPDAVRIRVVLFDRDPPLLRVHRLRALDVLVRLQEVEVADALRVCDRVHLER